MRSYKTLNTFFEATMKKNLLYFLTISLVLSGQALAATCETVVSGSDMMRYDVTEIKVDASCEKFKLTLNHVGKLPANIMGHNVVVVKESDFQAVIKSVNMSLGASSGYLPADAPTLLKTSLIGGGGSTDVIVDTSVFEKGQIYTFFCSFPGHYSIMKGVLLFH
jgi:azurin